ncbi:hypothetical protein AMATHDRAFT_147616 [Amanita thiersii Skay4041]|uniref:EthD domain-containing protein n=1 Tax=Amanita thiersii Skay4041 TaxID=703135 RepID=A0A2A9NHE1_9AGAR|nr:hypothetical protein AMATHDRAFT_147616 [Amanita thiersii Skay4041]
MHAGFLAVLSEPGELVTFDEFQDWYNNEHVPLRLDPRFSFLTAARFSALDGFTPSWIALYDTASTSLFEDESYKGLRKNRSVREADLVKRLAVLDRRTCERIWCSGQTNLTTSLAAANPTKIIMTHGLDIGDAAEVEKWAVQKAEESKLVEGWILTTIHKCIDTLKTGVTVPPGPDAQRVPPYFVMHGWCFPLEFLDSKDADEVIAKRFLSGVPELRKWELYRAWATPAQQKQT